MKRKKISYRKQLERKLDDLCRQYTKTIYKSCVTCGATDGLQWAHLFTARFRSTRWDVANFAAQCPGCNLKHEHDPYPYIKWFTSKYGQLALDNLHIRHVSGGKKTIQDLEELVRFYIDRLQ